MERLRNFIDGQWREAMGGQMGQQRDPADLTQITCEFPRSSRADAAAAIAAAQRAFPAWRQMPAAGRAALLGKVLAAMHRRKQELAEVLTRENGKTIKESLGEIDSGMAEVEWQIAEGQRLYGRIVESARPGVLAYVTRVPLGVVSVICPWNFPFSVACRKSTPALLAGNTLVLKPSSLTPRMGTIFVELFAEAGFPAGVINCVTGDGSTVGDELVRNPIVRAVSFTGSTPVGLGIHKLAAPGLVKTQLEMGGKNALVVLADADLDAAAESAVLATYACAGQWCTSTSRVIVESRVAGVLEQKILERVARIRVGRGTDPEATMGPVCGEAQRTSILGYIKQGVEEGATLAAGGRQITRGAMERGCFIEPTVFTNVTPTMTIAREEIFGPVMSIIQAADYAEALRIANESEFGLASAIYTASLEKALAFAERSEAGLVHVNMPTAHKEPQLPFGGIKLSGSGAPEAGSSGIEFFTEHKTVYIRGS